MSQESRNIDINRLHEKVFYVVADDARKDAVTVIFYIGWIISGLAIIFLALNYGGGAAVTALLAVAVAGSLLGLINRWWKRRLYVKYSPDYKLHR